jgi:hypothetical protein
MNPENTAKTPFTANKFMEKKDGTPSGFTEFCFPKSSSELQEIVYPPVICHIANWIIFAINQWIYL